MQSEQNAVRVHLLGTFGVTVHGRPVRKWRAGKSRDLFQFLLVHRNRMVTRDRLREALWPHLPPSAGATSVKAAVHGLRAALRPASGGRPAVGIHAVEGGYLLEGGDELWTDADAFTEDVSVAARAASAGDRTAAALRYGEALTRYRGPFLPGQEADWALEQRIWLRTRALRALCFLADEAVRTEDRWSAIEWQRRMIEVDPYAPDAYAMLAASHRALGLFAQARCWEELGSARLE